MLGYPNIARLGSALLVFTDYLEEARDIGTSRRPPLATLKLRLLEEGDASGVRDTTIAVVMMIPCMSLYQLTSRQPMEHPGNH